MMDDEELIQALRRSRPSPPPAPAGEWEAIALRTLHAPGWARLRRPAFAWAGGLALAALVLLPWTPWRAPEPAPDEAAELEELFLEAGRLERLEAGDAYLELLASIH